MITIFFIALGIFVFAGPVVMNMQGFTEKGFKRKLAVQALFGKIYYLSEVSNVDIIKPTYAYNVCLCDRFF